MEIDILQQLDPDHEEFVEEIRRQRPGIPRHRIGREALRRLADQDDSEEPDAQDSLEEKAERYRDDPELAD